MSPAPKEVVKPQYFARSASGVVVRKESKESVLKNPTELEDSKKLNVLSEIVSNQDYTEAEKIELSKIVLDDNVYSSMDEIE